MHSITRRNVLSAARGVQLGVLVVVLAAAAQLHSRHSLSVHAQPLDDDDNDDDEDDGKQLVSGVGQRECVLLVWDICTHAHTRSLPLISLPPLWLPAQVSTHLDTWLHGARMLCLTE
jgi:hypothetical protein